MKKGFYLIGKTDRDKYSVLDDRSKRYETFEQAEEAKDRLVLELMEDDITVQILKVD